MPLSPGTVVPLLLFLVIVVGGSAWVIRNYGLVEHVRTVRRVLRLRPVALAAGATVLLAGVVAIALLGSLEAPLRTALLAVSTAVAAGALALSVAHLDWYRASESLPVIGPDDIEAGPVQVADTAAMVDSVASSVTETDCIAYRAVTREERAVAGRGYASSTWVPRSSAFGATAFALENSDVVVDAGAAEFPLLSPTSELVNLSPAAPTLDGLERTVPAEPGTTVPVRDDLGRGTRPRPRRYSERRIDDGDEVYVLGTAVETDDGYRIVDDPDGPPLLVLRCSADEARAHASKFVRGYGRIALVGLAVAVGMALWLAV